jgi:aromatic-L-amino-acid/L-tryptophan decarboxylase
LRTANDDVTNYMDWGVQLGRRFRALKLWMVIRYFGQDGLAAHIRAHVAIAQNLAAQIDAHPDFERLAPTPLSTVCFRACPRDLALRLPTASADECQQIERYLDDLNTAIIDAVNTSGLAFLSHTRLNGHYTIRLAIGNIRTTADHVKATWALIGEEARRIDQTQRHSV